MRLYLKPGLSPMGVHCGHLRAHGNVDEAGAESRLGGCLSERRAGWNHGVQQGQGNGGSNATQERAALQMFFRKEHGRTAS